MDLIVGQWVVEHPLAVALFTGLIIGVGLGMILERTLSDIEARRQVKKAIYTTCLHEWLAWDYIPPNGRRKVCRLCGHARIELNAS